MMIDDDLWKWRKRVEELEQRERAEVTRMREHFGEQLSRRGQRTDDGIFQCSALHSQRTFPDPLDESFAAGP